MEGQKSEADFFNQSDPTLEEAERLFDPLQTDTWDLIERARQIRKQRFGNQAHLCTILNAKSGLCSEDCAFCSQSRHHHCSPPVYTLVSSDQMMEKAKEAQACGARCFSLVTSGRALQGSDEKQRLLKTIETIRNQTPLEVAVSLGLTNDTFLHELKAAGLSTYHHNLETAPSHYGKICTTHAYELRLQTVRAIKKAGLGLCSGGIFGLGESTGQRAELALVLKKIKADRIPINFLNPIAGTAMAGQARLRPLEALHIIAALRVVLPEPEILVCGGRETTLRSLQPLLFMAGANGIMTGNYLTTAGQEVAKDQKMLKDLALEIPLY